MLGLFIELPRDYLKKGVGSFSSAPLGAIPWRRYSFFGLFYEPIGFHMDSIETFRTVSEGVFPETDIQERELT
jgi:hypothetical protein